MDGRPNRRSKLAFPNSSGVVWTLPKRLPRNDFIYFLQVTQEASL